MENNVIVGWHGTVESRSKDIQNNGFDLKKFTQSKGKQALPGDLGYGTYLFIKDSVLAYDPKKHVVKFLKTYKNKNNEEKKLLKVEVENKDLLDLDLDENLEMFYKFKEDLKEQIETRASKLAPNGTLKRGNFDGLYIEIMIGYLKEKENLDVRLVSKRTFTNFKEKIGIHEIKKSNFPNGKELVIRDVDLVINIEEEVI